MPLKTYPATLPPPRDLPVELADGRAMSADAGPLDIALRSAEVRGTGQVTWRIRAEQAAAWRAWWRDDLVLGGEWFRMTVPGPGGAVAASWRFASGLTWAPDGAGHLTITATLDYSATRAA